MASLTKRFTVIQEKSQVEDELVAAIKERRNAELDLNAESGTLRVKFRTTATAHEDDHSLIVGTTEQHQTINLYLQRNGEVFALLPN